MGVEKANETVSLNIREAVGSWYQKDYWFRPIFDLIQRSNIEELFSFRSTWSQLAYDRDPTRPIAVYCISKLCRARNETRYSG